MRDLNPNLSQYVNGSNTPYYEPVIKSIRDLLENIDEINKSKGGAIVFFQKRDTAESDLTMQVYPFKPNIQLLNNTCTLSEDEIEQIFKQINSPKPYQDFWHQNQFKKHNSSDEHCAANIPSENIITYDDQKIEYTTHHPVSNEVLPTSSSWQEFFKNFEGGFINKNTYEQLLFESGCKGISFVPIPVLSTPSILLVLNNKYLSANKAGLFKSLYFRSRDTVDSYLYSRLLDSITPYLGKYAQDKANGEKRLVEFFVEEICNIILPISYTINNKKETFYYPHWPAENFNSEYILPLLDGKYTVVFKLTSFHYVDLEDPENPEWTWIHGSKLYESNKKQSALLVCKLFKLLHTNFELIKTADKRAYDELAKVIGGIDISGLQSKVNEIEGGLSRLLTDFGRATPINKLSIENNKVHLFVDAIEIVSPNECKSINQIAGFTYLNYLLMNSAFNNYVFEIKIEQLYEQVAIAKKNKTDPDISSKKQTAFRNIEDNLEDIYNNFLLFSKNYEKEISHVISENRISSKNIFNEAFYFNASFVSYITGSNIDICERLPQSFKTDTEEEGKLFKRGKNTISKATLLKKSISEIITILSIYNEMDRAGTTEAISKVEKASFTSAITKARKTLSLDPSGVDFKSTIRESFKAMIKLLIHNRENATGARLNSLEKLLQNLEAAGLIKAQITDADSHGGKYRYTQQHKTPYIKWEF